MSCLTKCDRCGIIGEHSDEFKTVLLEEEDGPFEWAPLRVKMNKYDMCIGCYEKFFRITSLEKGKQP